MVKRRVYLQHVWHRYRQIKKTHLSMSFKSRYLNPGANKLGEIPDATVADLQPFIALVGLKYWLNRVTEIRDLATPSSRVANALRQRHAVELTLERYRLARGAESSVAEISLGKIALFIARVAATLSARGRDKLVEQMRSGLSTQNTLILQFHLFRMAMLQRSRGFAVGFSGLEQDTPHDLVLTRDRVDAEMACDEFTAEDGRDLHLGAWLRLVDQVDADLQTWLRGHPGRYLLKITLPRGMRGGLYHQEPNESIFEALNTRIRAMLQKQLRQDYDEQIVLRLDPLVLVGTPAGATDLLDSLRQEFGLEAHLSIATLDRGVFVMAARAGRENQVASAVRRQLATLAPVRLTGSRPGILSVFVEDIDQLQWRELRVRHELEGEARKFLISPAARAVVAVSLVSRLELLGQIEPTAASGGELRFRNPGHPSAASLALAPSMTSSS